MLGLQSLRQLMVGPAGRRLWLDRKSDGNALARLVKGQTDPQSEVLECVSAPDIMQALLNLQQKVCGVDGSSTADNLVGEIGGVFNDWLTEERTVSVSASTIGWKMVVQDQSAHPGRLIVRDMPGGPVSDALNKLVWCLERGDEPLSPEASLDIVGSLAAKIGRQAMETAAVVAFARDGGVNLDLLKGEGLICEFEGQLEAERLLKGMGKQLDEVVALLAAQGVAPSIEELQAYMSKK